MKESTIILNVIEEHFDAFLSWSIYSKQITPKYKNYE